MNHHHESIALAEQHRTDLLAEAELARKARRGRRVGGHAVRSLLRRNREA